jgi:alkylation response protein AidB-like acyl-CoA dehydrogenase
MEFSWTASQLELYASTLKFARLRLNDQVLERERAHRFGSEEWARCGEFGLMGLSGPEAYGGMGLDALTTARVVEAFGRGCEDGGLVFSACAHLFACVMPICEHAAPELAARILPGLCAGTTIGANAITEAEAGSDVFALKMKVETDGDSFVLRGEKSYVTNGPEADLFLVYATENPAYGHMGISAFVVEADRPGIVVGAPFHKMGLTTSPVATVYFDGVRIPTANRLGRGGDGAKIFSGSMLWERACLFAAYVGQMDRQLDQTVSYAQRRRQFRKRIGRHQAVAHRIVEMKLRLEAARLLLYRACWIHDQGEDATLAISLAKLTISEAAVQSSLDAIQVHGGLGYVTDAGIERALRDAIPSRIFSGTSEIQRDLVASKLGL